MGYPESYNELAQWWNKQRLLSDGDALIRTVEDQIVAESDPDRVDILNRFLAQEHAARGNNVAAEAVFRRAARATRASSMLCVSAWWTSIGFAMTTPAPKRSTSPTSQPTRTRR
jgi:hypothetical protein